MVMLVLGSGCKYRLSLAERFDCTATIINQLFAGSYQNPISEWQVTIKLHLVTGYKAIPRPPQSLEKLSSTKLVPGVKKIGDHCARQYADSFMGSSHSSPTAALPVGLSALETSCTHLTWLVASNNPTQALSLIHI